MARGVKIGMVGVVCAGMLGVAGYGVYDIVGAVTGGGGGGSSKAAHTSAPRTPAAPPDAAEVTRTAGDFLTAWSSGDTTKAAQLTDSAQTATTALADYRTNGHITAVTATPTQTTGTRVSFSVRAHVTLPGVDAYWTYASSLTVGRNASGDPAVAWHESVLHPSLKDGQTIGTGRAAAPQLTVVDRHGVELTSAAYPSLGGILAKMRTAYADKVTGGTPGIETYALDASGAQVATLNVLRKGEDRKLRTTLDAAIQHAAEKAVAGRTQAGVTALDTRTGEIRAIANSPATGFDHAMNDKDAPGSTFKIVTAAALLQHGMTRGSTAPCVNGRNYDNGMIYHNDDGVPNRPNATLEWDFAVSCNTGFITQAGRLGASGLRDTAAQFGLDQPWHVGTPCTDPRVAGGSGDEMTAEMIGQGSLQMSPLIMASVAATARDGAFHQPRIVARSLIDGPVATAPGLPSGVSVQLRKMMHSAIAYGTASGVMRGFGPDSGAKTGSAEVDGQAATNGWFTAFSGRLTAAAVVHDAGHGNSSAGPIVAAVLAAG